MISRVRRSKLMGWEELFASWGDATLDETRFKGFRKLLTKSGDVLDRNPVLHSGRHYTIKFLPFYDEIKIVNKSKYV